MRASPIQPDPLAVSSRQVQTGRPETLRTQRLTPLMALRRSARVRTVRIVFMAIATASILALVGSVALRMMLPSNLDTEDLVQGDSFVVDRPKFTAVSATGQKMTITAARAIRAIGDAQGELKLEKPRLETSEGSVATSDLGTWNEAGQIMQLSDNVLFVGQRGQKARSKAATWTSANRRMALRGALQVDMEAGVAVSDQGVWDDLAQTLGMQGNVKMTLKEGEVATADSAFWNGPARTLALAGNARVIGPKGEIATAPKAIWQANERQLVMQEGASLQAPQGQAKGQTITWNAGTNGLQLVGAASFVTPSGESASGGQLDWNALTRTISVSNGSLIRFSGGQVRSDSARYQMITGNLSGAGNVQISSGVGIGTGSNFVYDTKSRRLKLTGAAKVVVN
jgi:hypothetical protein